jgi:hypothetical protein
MSVRAVTPYVPALGGGLQFYRDLDWIDVEQDERWDHVAGSDFHGSALNTDLPRGSNGRRVRGVKRTVASPMYEAAGHAGGRHTRPAASPSSTSVEAVSPGHGEPSPLGSSSDACPRPEPSPRARAGDETSSRVSRPGGRRDGS